MTDETEHEQVALMPVEHSYDIRAKQIIALRYTPAPAEQPAPVVLPERFNAVMQYLMGIGDLDGYYFRDSHPSGRKYWWRNELRACLDEVARLNGVKP